MFKLPVSGLMVTIRQPTGMEDLLLHEPQSSPVATSLALIDSLSLASGNARLDGQELIMTDLEALMLQLRRLVFGNFIRGEALCLQASCGARVGITFRVDEFLANCRPRLPRGVEKPNGAGWFCVAGEPVKFRLPQCHDIIDIQSADGKKSPAAIQRALADRCIDPPTVRPRLQQRIERAMRMIAAPLSSDLAGTCPDCGALLTTYFDVVSFVLAELRNHAASIYQDVHLIAFHYKWPEEKILALPRSRRLQYAEMIRGERRIA